MSYKDILEKANAAYIRETETRALAVQTEALDKLLAEKDLLPDYRAKAEALRRRMYVKLCALLYIKSFDGAVLERTLNYIAAEKPDCEEKGFKKTVAVMDAAAELLKKVAFAAERTDEIKKSLLYRGVRVADFDACGVAAKEITFIKETVEKQEFLNPFGENVAFADVRAETLKRLDDVLSEVNGMGAAAVKSAVSDYVFDISNEFALYEYFPLPDCDEGGRARATVLCTPFKDEAKLYATFARRETQDERGRKNKVKLYCLDCSVFERNGFGFAENVFMFLKTEDADCLAFGAEALTDKVQTAFLKCAMHYGKDGGQVFVVDESGDGKLYAAALAAAQEDKTLSSVDVSRTYISVPAYSDAEQELRDRGMLSEPADYERLKRMPFMGFAGLNKIVRARVQGMKNWYDVGIRLSAENRDRAERYLRKLPSVYLLIDSGWGDFSSFDTEKDDGGHEFDYDGIKSVHLKNVRAIVESGESVFAKCGMIARYCTTGGGDRLDWQKLSKDEMQDRLDMATKLVFKVLGVTEVVPEVQLLDELDNPTAGGLCIDGGKQIRYKYSCMLGDWEWAMGCIVHESFHALQNKLAQGGWSRWYYDNMGITRGRVEQWLRTRKIYNPNTKSDVYQVHIYESDARAFEADCDDGRNYAWNGMDFDF